MNPKTIFAIALIALFYTNLYSQCTIAGPTNVCKTIEYTYSVNLDPDQTVRWKLVNRFGKFMSTNLNQCIIQFEKVGSEILLAEIRASNGTIVSQCSLSISISHFDDFDIKPLPASGGIFENKSFNACKNTNLKFITTLFSNYLYSWTYNSNPVGNNSNTVEFNSGNLPTGELCLTVVNLINSCSKTICLQINLFDPPSVDFKWYGGNDPNLLNICLGDEILFTNNSMHENGNTYIWELILAGSVLQSTNSSNPKNPFLTTYSTPGTYIVRLTGYNATKCKTIKEETIYVNLNVKLKINSIRNTVCEGEELVYSVADICSDYSWTVENGVFNPAPGNNPTATVVWQNPGPSGIGTIFITPSNCQSSICNATSKEHVFIIPSNLDDYISGPQTICDIESNTVALYIAPKWPGVDYNWEISGPGTQNFITTKRANEFLVNINAGFNGSFMVHLSLSSSLINCTNSGSLSVDVYNNKILDITPQHCYNTDAQFEIENYNSNMIVNWTLVFNGIELLTSSDYPLTISKTLMSKAGIYNLFAEVHMNGMNCNQKLDFKVMNPIQSPIEVAGQQYICPGTEHMYSIGKTGQTDHL
ncbi:MAG: hypothetical protein V9E90_10710 [Saprospiraceae bacterium]